MMPSFHSTYLTYGGLLFLTVFRCENSVLPSLKQARLIADDIRQNYSSYTVRIQLSNVTFHVLSYCNIAKLHSVTIAQPLKKGLKKTEKYHD